MRLDVELDSEDTTVHVVEVVGISLKSPRDAVWRAVSGVLNPARHVVGLDVIDRAIEAGGQGVKFRAKVKLAYTCDPDTPRVSPDITPDICG